MLGDFTTLTRLKTYLGETTTGKDAVLALLITAVSRAFLAELERASIISRSYSRYFDASCGQSRLMLPDWPVTSVSAFNDGGCDIPAAVRGQAPNGYLLTPWDGSLPGYPQMIDMKSRYFRGGAQSVAVTYAAGYLVSGEPATVAVGAATVAQASGIWAADGGVVYASSGVALVPVASAPAVGQYALSPTILGGYVFNTAENGVALLISYSFIPADLEEVAWETINERLQYKGRAGEKSKTLGGQETVTYDTSDMNQWTKNALMPYKLTVPI